MLIQRHDGPFSCVGANLGGKPFETFEKGLGRKSSEGGNTGRRADWPCHINSRMNC
jgi:hypothetical protein